MITNSGSLYYLHCGNCDHGKHYEWYMTEMEYHNLVIRQCPKCGFIDTDSSFGDTKIEKSIMIDLKAKDY